MVDPTVTQQGPNSDHAVTFELRLVIVHVWITLEATPRVNLVSVVPSPVLL